MAMDITPLFKACVQTAWLKNRTLALSDKNRILKSTQNKGEFASKAKDISNKITQLRVLLIENRPAYMKFACHLKNYVQLTDAERDIIDQESVKIITICTKLLMDFRQEIGKYRVNNHSKHHMIAVIEMLTAYVKAVSKIYEDQKSYRVQWEVENYKFLKLNSGTKMHPILGVDKREDNLKTFEDTLNKYRKTTESSTDRSENTKEQVTVNGDQLAIDEEMEKTRLASEVETLSADEIQMFESENVQLYNELQGLSDEVDQIEKSVVGIAKLQEIFTEKVSDQQQDIDRIANIVVGSTENVKDANEQIKKAIQRNAGLRVYVLFFLIVMSSTLLFLDWYNE